jgi:hypothetical protein
MANVEEMNKEHAGHTISTLPTDLSVATLTLKKSRHQKNEKATTP